MSTKKDLLDGCLSVITGLNLTLVATPVTVIEGKVPKVEEGLEQRLLPIIYLSCSEQPDRSVWWDTGNGSGPRKKNDYLIEVSYVAAGNRDPSTGLGSICDWRQEIARNPGGDPKQVGVTISGGNVYDVDVDLDPVFDRPAWASNYDLGMLHLRFACIEPGGGPN